MSMKLLDSLTESEAMYVLGEHLLVEVTVANRASAIGTLIEGEELSVGKVVNSDEWVAEASDGKGMDCVYRRTGDTLFLAVARVVIEKKLSQGGQLHYMDDHCVDSNLLVRI